MGMKWAEEPFNMGMLFFFLPIASFKMGTFSDRQHTHPDIFILELPPWDLGVVPLQSFLAIAIDGAVDTHRK